MPTRMTTLDRPASSPGTLPRSARRNAAGDMVARYAENIGIALQPSSVQLGSGARVVVDGAAADQRVVVEACTASAPLTHLDLACAAPDVFTLALIRSSHPQTSTVLLVADEAVRDAVAATVARTPASGGLEIAVCP